MLLLQPCFQRPAGVHWCVPGDGRAAVAAGGVTGLQLARRPLRVRDCSCVLAVVLDAVLGSRWWVSCSGCAGELGCGCWQLEFVVD